MNSEELYDTEDWRKFRFTITSINDNLKLNKIENNIFFFKFLNVTNIS